MNCYVLMEGVGSQKAENSLHCTTRVKARGRTVWSAMGLQLLQTLEKYSLRSVVS